MSTRTVTLASLREEEVLRLRVVGSDYRPPSTVKPGRLRNQLLKWHELAEWQKGDELLQSGYREATPTLAACVESWFYLHNESVNIFSHLFGSALFVVLAFTLYAELSPSCGLCSIGDLLAFAVFMFGVALCFGLSATFHTCASHSHEGYLFSRHLDFLGIITLVLATSAPQVWYTFYDNSTLRVGYWSAITLFGLLAAILTFLPSFSQSSGHGNSVRVGVFAALGLSTFAPVVHGILLHGWEGQSERFPLWTLGFTHGFNIFGAVVYVTHFPERWWPKRFDIFGASHQLMHCAIVGAAISLLTGSILAFENVHGRTRVWEKMDAVKWY